MAIADPGSNGPSFEFLEPQRRQSTVTWKEEAAIRGRAIDAKAGDLLPPRVWTPARRHEGDGPLTREELIEGDERGPEADPESTGEVPDLPQLTRSAVLHQIGLDQRRGNERPPREQVAKLLFVLPAQLKGMAAATVEDDMRQLMRKSETVLTPPFGADSNEKRVPPAGREPAPGGTRDPGYLHPEFRPRASGQTVP
ncbi:MAG TPA: hypothetical protein VF255_09450 [Solirubrobacterales bacterium]